MEPSDLDALLGLVKNMHEELERYLTNAALSSDVMPRVLDMCKQMRTMELNETAKYWLDVMEHHAIEIMSPRPPLGHEEHLLASSVFLGTQLSKDAYFLRAELANGCNSAD